MLRQNCNLYSILIKDNVTFCWDHEFGAVVVLKQREVGLVNIVEFAVMDLVSKGLFE